MPPNFDNDARPDCLNGDREQAQRLLRATYRAVFHAYTQLAPELAAPSAPIVIDLDADVVGRPAPGVARITCL